MVPPYIASDQAPDYKFGKNSQRYGPQEMALVEFLDKFSVVDQISANWYLQPILHNRIATVNIKPQLFIEANDDRRVITLSNQKLHLFKDNNNDIMVGTGIINTYNRHRNKIYTNQNSFVYA
jgi:hypothetical protein